MGLAIICQLVFVLTKTQRSWEDQEQGGCKNGGACDLHPEVGSRDEGTLNGGRVKNRKMKGRKRVKSPDQFKMFLKLVKTHVH